MTSPFSWQPKQWKNCRASWTWNEGARYRGRPVRAVTTLVGFALAQPVAWMAWLGRLAIDRVRRGPARRETEFRPYPEALAEELSAAA